MFNLLKETRVLREEGKLHRKLLNRVRMMFVISLILLCVVLYNILVRGADPLLVALFAVVGFFPGVYVFSRMSPILWNEEAEVVETGAMGKFGYGILALYIVFEIGLRTLFITIFPVAAIAYILSMVFGLLLGRGVGMLIEIHRVYRASHTI